MCNILLITDEAFFKEGFVGFVDKQRDPDIVISGHVETLEAAHAVCRELHIDIVIVDHAVAAGRLGALTGLAADVAGTASVLVIGPPQEADRVGEILATGVRSYIQRTSDGRAILSEIRKTLEEGAVANGLSRQGFVTRRPLGSLPRMAHQVSAREMMVLKRTAFGYSAKEIARELAISQKSVETYKARATAKLGLVSRSDIIRYALRSGWFSSLLDEGRSGLAARSPPEEEHPWRG